MTADRAYPVGPFEPRSSLGPEERARLIDQIEQTPDLLAAAVEGLDARQLATPYREGGWSVRQVVHHVADSHLNAYVRFKLALTEKSPTIKPYDQDAWSTLPDVSATPIEVSLTLLRSVHVRWVAVMRQLGDEDWRRPFVHPEHGAVDIDWLLQNYAWHGRHHTAHITTLRERMGWQRSGVAAGWKERFALVPFNRQMGMDLVEAAGGKAVVRLPLSSWFSQEMGVVHGGILTSLADTAAVYAVLSELGEEVRMTSIELKVNFLASSAVPADALTARAIVLRRGRRVAVCESKIWQGEKLLLAGLFTYLIMAS